MVLALVFCFVLGFNSARAVFCFVLISSKRYYLGKMKKKFCWGRKFRYVGINLDPETFPILRSCCIYFVIFFSYIFTIFTFAAFFFEIVSERGSSETDRCQSIEHQTKSDVLIFLLLTLLLKFKLFSIFSLYQRTFTTNSSYKLDVSFKKKPVLNQCVVNKFCDRTGLTTPFILTKMKLVILLLKGLTDQCVYILWEVAIALMVK